MQIAEMQLYIDLSIDNIEQSIYNCIDKSLHTSYHTPKGGARKIMKINVKKIVAAMADAGIDSYKALAADAGVSVNTISRLCNGGSAKAPTLRALAASLGVSVADIIEKED